MEFLAWYMESQRMRQKKFGLVNQLRGGFALEENIANPSVPTTEPNSKYEHVCSVCVITNNSIPRRPCKWSIERMNV